MNTEKTHQRFWEAMRARFGVRWLTEFGDKPSAPWVQLLNAYTPEALRAALVLMAEQKLVHPPTLPMFEDLLRKAALHSAPAPVDWVRGYWRSVIMLESARTLMLKQVIPHVGAFEAYLIAHKKPLGESLRALLDELCDAEQRNQGQRTVGLQVHAIARCEAIVKSHQHQEVITC